MSQKNESKSNQKVITIRIDTELNDQLDAIKNRLGVSKADLIRNYLELSKCLLKQKSSLKSLNNRDFIIVKRSYLRKMIAELDEEEQIRSGDKLARFINDLGRINGKDDDIIYKLELCDYMGFFPFFVDNENSILVTKKFGPQRFVEAFTYRLFKKKEYNIRFIEEELKGSKSLRDQYNKEVQPEDKTSSHYSFKFAKVK
ncbi:MAG: ribbon-helix-helix protein, CopG family [Candidatus Lokiarchaeota archaeon]